MKNVPILIFVIVEATLGALIQFTSGTAERILCFSAVLLAMLFAMLSLRKSFSALLTAIGLLFTVCADVFLVLIPDGDKLLAMCFFTCVQLFYFVRVFRENDSNTVRKCHIISRISILAFAFLLTVIVLGENSDALSVISVLYFANLLVNIVFSFFNVKRSPLFAIGLLLFAFCDILVGFSMLDFYIPISETSLIYLLNHTGINLIWLFYVPSQTLIALSSGATGEN